MISACKNQCSVCPFHPGSLPGWLGSYAHDEIHRIAWFNQPFFCHSKIDYENPDWLAGATKVGKICRGFLKFSNQMMAPKRTDGRYEAGTQLQIIDLRKTVERDQKTKAMSVMDFVNWHDPKNTAKNMKRLRKKT